MRYVKLGSSGLQVSRICLGMMSYGDPRSWEWMLREDAAEPIVRRAAEAGVTFFDTADMYSDGASEEITGRLLAKLFARRDDYVLATKVYFPMGPGPNDRGLSRKHVLAAIDASLTRLGTDYVDLYQIHRWDHETPIEETMEALHDVVRAGKARYIGASSMYAWQFAKAQHTAQAAGGVLSDPAATSWPTVCMSTRTSTSSTWCVRSLTNEACLRRSSRSRGCSGGLA
ncbi:aldo/keto reductase [Streptosporangium roseum]|uniref:aldo/keto reductase n=1 Tax=Streptosporangium roseum TaxID=2001 RepID=UPI00331FFF1A